MSNKNDNVYNNDFPRMIVEPKVKDSSSKDGISDVKTYSWIKKLTTIDRSKKDSLTPQEFENDSLKKQHSYNYTFNARFYMKWRT